MTRSIRPTPSLPNWLDPERVMLDAETILSQLAELRPCIHDTTGEVHVLLLPFTFELLKLNPCISTASIASRSRSSIASASARAPGPAASSPAKIFQAGHAGPTTPNRRPRARPARTSAASPHVRNRCTPA
jgi:hypothetical protein